MSLEERIRPVVAAFDGTIGIALRSLENDFAWYENSDEIFHAASIIKVPILLELFRQVDEGALTLDEEVVLRDEDKVGGAGILMEMHRGLVLTLKDCAILMTVISDNTASNILFDRVGRDNVNELMKKLGAKRSLLRKKFMKELHDPAVINVTTPFDTMVMLDKLYRGGIMSSASCGEVIEILSRQQYNEKIPLLLPEGIKIAHKTGEVSGIRHDAGIVFLEGNPYIICVFTKNAGDHLRADRTIAEISKAGYDYFLDRDNCASL